MKRFGLLFAALLLCAYSVVYAPPIREHLIGPFTEGITYLSALLIQSFGGRAWVQSNVLSIPGFAVQVLDMCNGVEASVIFWSAVLAFPAPLAYKLKGLLIGTFTIHFLNILRIVSLTYLGAYKPDWFHWAHWYLWDALIMLDILMVFLLWIRWLPDRTSIQHHDQATAPI
ncbi:MAG: exosortase H [Gammaproteobacteria bacterium]